MPQISGRSPSGEQLPILVDSFGNLTISSVIVGDYKLSDLDTDTDIEYYGYLTTDGKWYILKLDNITSSARYCVGSINYNTNWTNRSTLTYKYFNEVFNTI